MLNSFVLDKVVYIDKYGRYGSYKKIKLLINHRKPLILRIFQQIWRGWRDLDISTWIVMHITISHRILPTASLSWATTHRIRSIEEWWLLSFTIFSFLFFCQTFSQNQPLGRFSLKVAIPEIIIILCIFSKSIIIFKYKSPS